MTGDRNASLLAVADAIMDTHHPRPEFSSAPDVTDARRVRFRDAIYDALASSSASGAERMRERAILASIAACAEISAHFDEAEFPTQSAGNFVLGGIEEAETAVVQAIRALPLPDPAPGPAWRPKAKALRWKAHGADVYANTGVGQYSVGLVGRGYVAILRHIEDGGQYDVDIVRGVATIEAAKAVAQADYEARILSALDVPEPVTEVVDA